MLPQLLGVDGVPIKHRFELLIHVLKEVPCVKKDSTVNTKDLQTDQSDIELEIKLKEHTQLGE